jgi:hypothetical protein
MAQQGARGRGTSEKCGEERGRRRDALAVKGQRLLPKTLYRAWAWAHRLFHSRINPSLLPHTWLAWQLPHYAEHFCLARESRHRGSAPESMHDPSGLQNTHVPLFWRHAKPGTVIGHIKFDRSCRRACAPLFGRTQATGGSVAGARPGATICALDQGVPAPVAWPAPRRERIRTHRAAARSRHCRPVSHHFTAAKNRPQAHLQEEDEDSRYLGYI